MLSQKRQAIRHLLDEQNPEDAMAAYFAFYHPDNMTNIVTYPADADRATGYLAFSRTGMDLFRPLVTLRLPQNDMQAGAGLIEQAVGPGTAVFLSSRPQDYPLVQAMFDIQTEETLLTYELDRNRFEPIINVFVTRSKGPNSLPRFVIQKSEGNNQMMAASAGLNWLSPIFGEISVNTSPNYRRRGWGRSVVASMVNYLLENGRKPLYVVSQQNEASMQLAERVGFTYRGIQQILVQAVRRSPQSK
ncbi:MAG: GNAT family N-acetyltransferase [Chloroflexi bacterium]|nr:MAG: GNAT family N-acetyltransferase [Chloroflexota bacterium]